MATLDVGLGRLGSENEDVLDVLDLPQLYTKPSAQTLLSTLADLSTEPPKWDRPPSNNMTIPESRKWPSNNTLQPGKRRKIRSEGVPRYLTNIISSPLTWIEDEEDKELIWETAAQRLSERSGRTARGAINRSFTIPTISVTNNDTGSEQSAEDICRENMIDITLHEPALTADNVGFKTWASSYLLAKRIAMLKPTLPQISSDTYVLELGAGTGLVGLAAAAILDAPVMLTDLPEILPNLERNAQGNAVMLGSNKARVEVAVLDWSEPESFQVRARNAPGPASFPLILVADPIYSLEHPRLLVQAINYHLSKNSLARVVIELPIREAFAAEREDFRDRMTQIGLFVLEEGEDVGFDDWSSGVDQDELLEVRCWWSVWGWT